MSIQIKRKVFMRVAQPHGILETDAPRGEGAKGLETLQRGRLPAPVWPAQHDHALQLCQLDLNGVQPETVTESDEPTEPYMVKSHTSFSTRAMPRALLVS